MHVPFTQTAAVTHQPAFRNGAETGELFHEIVFSDIEKEVPNVNGFLRRGNPLGPREV